jgi:hypothetical protein
MLHLLRVKRVGLTHYLGSAEHGSLPSHRVEW